MINDNMRLKLRQLARRLEEIDGMLAAPECAQDMTKFRALTKERADIEPVVQKHHELEQTDLDLQTAKEMLQDPDMKDFAQEEVQSAQAKLEVIEHELQILLLPKDPNDSRNIFLEIRAGTGATNRLFSRATYCVCTFVMPKTKIGKPRSSPKTKVNWVATKKSSFASSAKAHILVSSLNRAAIVCNVFRLPKVRGACIPLPVRLPCCLN